MTIRILLALLLLAPPAIAVAGDDASAARDRTTRAVSKPGAITVAGCCTAAIRSRAPTGSA